MRPLDNKEHPILDSTNGLSALSIVIDDFDSLKQPSSNKEPLKTNTQALTAPKPYTRQSSDASIKKILEEAEHRKHEFWKLIDEHNAVIENLKRIEKQEPSNAMCKMAQSTIKT